MFCIFDVVVAIGVWDDRDVGDTCPSVDIWTVCCYSRPMAVYANAGFCVVAG